MRFVAALLVLLAGPALAELPSIPPILSVTPVSGPSAQVRICTGAAGGAYHNAASQMLGLVQSGTGLPTTVEPGGGASRGPDADDPRNPGLRQGDARPRGANRAGMHRSDGGAIGMTDPDAIAAIRELLAARKDYAIADTSREGAELDRAEARLDAAIDALRALLAAHDAQPEVPMVQVRIAVGVRETGFYYAVGWAGGTDDGMRDDAARNVGPHPHTHFVTARVPLPQKPQEIEGRVEHG